MIYGHAVYVHAKHRSLNGILCAKENWIFLLKYRLYLFMRSGIKSSRVFTE